MAEEAFQEEVPKNQSQTGFNNNRKLQNRVKVSNII
jgi:hypothetical protein